MQLRFFASALVLLTQDALAQQMMRFSCSKLVFDRIDPLVNPGVAPSPHLHQIVGGNSFTADMDPASHDPVTKSSCTSCTFSEDFSNYWTATLYFKARNGTLKRVPQMANDQIGTANGGLTIYYTAPGPNTTTAFKPVCFPH